MAEGGAGEQLQRVAKAGRLAALRSEAAGLEKDLGLAPGQPAGAGAGVPG